MGEETRKILEMLREGKIGTEEAERLLAAVAPEGRPAAAGAPEAAASAGIEGASGVRKRYLRVQVEPQPGTEHGDRVNIRVPLKLIRSGLKLAAFLPKDAQTQVDSALREKGVNIDLSQMKPQDLEDLVSNLDELTVDVEGKEKVRIFTE